MGSIKSIEAGLCFGLAAMVMAPAPAQAVILHESATLASPPFSPLGGIVLSGVQYLGSRFSVSSNVNVTQVRGQLQASSGTFFAAIINLSSSTALPTGLPFSSGEVIASTTFAAPSGAIDTIVPLAASLAIGDYALIFGGGLGTGGAFGSTGSGAMARNGTPLAASNFFWDLNQNKWINSSDFDGARFVVSNSPLSPTPMPEPATLALFVFGLAGLGFARRRKAAA